MRGGRVGGRKGGGQLDRPSALRSTEGPVAKVDDELHVGHLHLAQEGREEPSAETGRAGQGRMGERGTR